MPKSRGSWALMRPGGCALSAPPQCPCTPWDQGLSCPWGEGTAQLHSETFQGNCSASDPEQLEPGQKQSNKQHPPSSWRLLPQPKDLLWDLYKHHKYWIAITSWYMNTKTGLTQNIWIPLFSENNQVIFFWRKKANNPTKKAIKPNPRNITTFIICCIFK